MLKFKRSTILIVLFVFATFLLQAQNKQNLIIKSLPEDLPPHLSVPINYSGEKLTLELEKTSVFGKNTRFLVDDGTGKLIEVNKGPERVYVGYVAEHPNFEVSAVMTDQGLMATIDRPGQDLLEIKPSANDRRSHEISNAKRVSCDTNGCSIESNDHTEDDHKEQFKNIINTKLIPSDSNIPSENNRTFSKAASRRPTTVMDVLEYEVAVEIGSKTFFATTAYNGDLASAQASAQSIIGNLNLRFLRAAGIKHVLGNVIIRTNASTDPLRDQVTNAGSAGRSSLDAFINYWNNNPSEVGTTHDIAVYHVLSSPSGITWRSSVGTNRRYAICAGRAATSWANGTAAHEVGHMWSLRHTGDSGLFYESKPRNNAGSNAAGGEDVFISIMHGSGTRNIARLATNEARSVINERNAKRSFGELNTNPGPVPPFGVYDEIEIQNPNAAIVLDVIANDYDVNNDVLDVRLLDAVSQKGGTISLSSGTGPGGRNELRYTPPAGFTGTDFFHYTVFDTTERTDFGAVYISSTAITVDLNATTYNYDLGTPASPVQSGWQRISEKTKGDISWSGAVQSRDRGAKSGVNDINRDFIQSSARRVLRHKIRNGIWAVTLNLGDHRFNHDNMSVKAEGKTIGSNINTSGTNFPAVNANVEVRDGQLNIEIADNGGSDANWVWTRLSLRRVGDLPGSNAITVDLNATKYDYDLGTPTSPVQSGWQRISDKTTGDVSWSRAVKSVDRGARSGVNNINRDLVYGSQTTALRHKIKNGTWAVVLNLGDHRFNHDNMRVKAEGTTIGSNINSSGTTFPYVRANNVVVRDGELNIELSDNGGSDRNWVWTRLTLTRVSDSTRESDIVVSNNENLENIIKPYPNPVNDLLNLDLSEDILGKTSIVIYDGIGRALKTIKVEEQETRIDVSDLPSGLYFIRLMGDIKKTIHVPFIKK